jgi:1-acyl-sn-glycerol-3-phosphate acyltransferase
MAELRTDTHNRAHALCSYTHILPTATHINLAILTLYTPLGITILAARAIAVAATALALAAANALVGEERTRIVARPALQALALVCGVRTTIRGRPVATLAAARVIVANHVAQHDGLAIVLNAAVSVLVRTTYREHAFARLVTSAMACPIYVPPPAHRGAAERRAALDDVRRVVAAHLAAAEEPLLFYPEGSITNGAGLMRFERFIFGLNQPVLPVALRVHAPLPLAHDTLWSPLPVNFARALFQPWQRIEATILPTLEPLAGEAPEAFARRAQLAIADELGVPPTDCCTADKAAMMRSMRALGKKAVLAAFGGRRRVPQAKDLL